MAERVIESVRPVRAEQNIVTWLAEQLPVTGLQVCPSVGEVDRVNQRRARVGGKQQRPTLPGQVGNEGGGLPRLGDPPIHARQSVIRCRDKWGTCRRSTATASVLGVMPCVVCRLNGEKSGNPSTGLGSEASHEAIYDPQKTVA